MSDIKRIAVLTSGGDAPGMNAAVRAVVRTASHHDLHVYGIRRGYAGMIDGDIGRLETGDVANIMHRGGTILKTARSEEFREKKGRKEAYDTLMAHDIDACIVIGGNGTYTGAHKFVKEFDIPMIGLPGTIDNDIFGTDETIGFDTAINTAVEAIDKIRDTADSHNRLFFVEVMGRDAGYIALHTGLGSGAGNIFLPETDTTVDDLIAILRKASRRKKLFNLVIVAEGNKNGNAVEIADRVAKKYDDYDIRVTIIGHLQRGGSPTCRDRVLSSRLGFSAVNAILEGKSDVAIGVINNEITYTPFSEAINHKKSLNGDLLKMAGILAT